MTLICIFILLWQSFWPWILSVRPREDVSLEPTKQPITYHFHSHLSQQLWLQPCANSIWPEEGGLSFTPLLTLKESSDIKTLFFATQIKLPVNTVRNSWWPFDPAHKPDLAKGPSCIFILALTLHKKHEE